MHHGIKLASLVGLVYLAAAGTGCSRVRQLASGTAAASAEPSSVASASASTTTTSATVAGGGWSVKPKPDGTSRPWVNEAGRQGKCTFVGWQGTGDERRSMFKLDMPAGKKANHVQTWQFYYDATGKQIDEYPSATNPSSGDDDGVQDLGERGRSIKSGVDSVECEITTIGFTDGTYWWNENLVAGMRRPKGGFPDSMLKEHTGERVAVDAVDLKKSTVTVRNLTDHPMSRIEVELLCWTKDEDGKDDTETDSDWIDLNLGPKATSTAPIDIRSSKFDHCSRVEGTVSSIEYPDETVFINRNLKASSRPSP